MAVRKLWRCAHLESRRAHRPTSRPADSLGARKSLKTGGWSTHALPYTLGSMSRIRARGKPKFGFPMAPPHKAEAKNKSAVRELLRQVGNLLGFYRHPPVRWGKAVRLIWEPPDSRQTGVRLRRSRHHNHSRSVAHPPLPPHPPRPPHYSRPLWQCSRSSRLLCAPCQPRDCAAATQALASVPKAHISALRVFQPGGGVGPSNLMKARPWGHTKPGKGRERARCTTTDAWLHLLQRVHGARRTIFLSVSSFLIAPQTHAPERKHPQLQRNEWQALTDSTVSITIELQQPQ